ncbi:zinc finger CCHC-type containing 7 [Pitangus sulphuratus]|nr:zinc finger CCHC-type containing 7 [Pitangus sulphuratus]
MPGSAGLWLMAQVAPLVPTARLKQCSLTFKKDGWRNIPSLPRMTQVKIFYKTFLLEEVCPKREVDVDWSISHKDLEAQISNYASVRHSSMRYYTADKNATSRNCNRPGHLSKNCPTPKTKPGPIKTASGHSERSVSVYCYNCSRKGHFGYECSEKRMHGSMFPTSPFVYYYDDECDIKRRANRLKRKVADLQEAGLLPEQSKAPCQEEQLEEHSHKKKSKPWKGQHRKQNRDGEQYKKMKVSQAGKSREKKNRRGVEILCDPEGDFPRGCKQQLHKGSRVRRKSVFQAFSGRKAGCVQEPLEGVKRKKKWKKQKDASPDSKDNLLLIKQRRKKSKQKCW